MNEENRIDFFFFFFLLLLLKFLMEKEEEEENESIFNFFFSGFFLFYLRARSVHNWNTGNWQMTSSTEKKGTKINKKKK